jgi:integrase
MTVAKECRARGCRLFNHRCDHSWVARFQHTKQRYAIRVDEFAVARGGPAHVESKSDAKEWLKAMLVEAKAGGDPRLKPPPAPVPVPADTIKQLLDDYRVARLGQLRQKGTPRSELKHLQAFFSDEDPATLLEDETRVAEYTLALRVGWKPESAPGQGRGVIAVNRLLTRWRNVVEWAMGQQPPRLTHSPFHAYGMVIKTSEEEPRTRRLEDGEEAALFAALAVLDDKQHRFRKDVMTRVVLAALRAAMRQSELCRVRETDVDWTRCILTLRKGSQKPKASDARHIPFEPEGDLDQAIRPRRFLKFPNNFIFGNDDGTSLTENKQAAANYRHAWVTLNLTAHDYLPAPEGVAVTRAYKAEGMRAINLTLRDLRRECASRWWKAGVDIRSIQLLLGHSTIKTTEKYLQLGDTDELTNRLGDALGWVTAPQTHHARTQTGLKRTTNAPQSRSVSVTPKLVKRAK